MKDLNTSLVARGICCCVYMPVCVFEGEFGNKSVWCVQLRWKLLEPRGQCLVRFNLQSLRVLAVGGLDSIAYSDWLSASCSMTILA